MKRQEWCWVQEEKAGILGDDKMGGNKTKPQNYSHTASTGGQVSHNYKAGKILQGRNVVLQTSEKRQ